MRSILPLAFLCLSVPSTWAQVNVLTQHNDNARTGQNLNEVILTPQNVNASSFGQVFSVTLDGLAYTQPLYVSNLTLPGAGSHNVVFVATETDKVYAIDADSGGAPLWQASLIDAAHGAAPGAVPESSTCREVVPVLGITGTPVIDLPSKTMYVVTRSVENGAPLHRLHAIDITTGAERPNSPVLIQATVPNQTGGLTMDAHYQRQRTGLLLLNGIVYIAFAGICDTTPWHGWLLAYDASSLTQTGAYSTTPDGWGSGIWMSGAGLPADVADPVNHPFGRLFIATGNGSYDGVTDYGDDYERFDLSGGRFTYSDSFTPSVQNTLSTSDGDLGSGGILLLPDQVGPHPHLMLQGGKGGVLYLVDRDNMGGYNPTDNAVQEISGLGGLFSAPAYWNGNVYVWSRQDHLRQYSVTNGTLQGPVAISNEVAGNGSTSWLSSSTPSISANGAANGIVWNVDWTANYLYAHDASNVATTLFAAQLSSTSTKFSVPTIANGKVYIAGYDRLSAFGVLSKPDFTIASAPSSLTIAPGTSASSTISVAPMNGFAGPVSFTLGSLPAGVTASLSAPSLSTSGSVALTVSAAAGASGTGTITVTGSSSSISHSTTVNVVIPSSVPVPPPPGTSSAPTGLWPLTSINGSITPDVSGNNNNAALTGATLASSSSGNWIHFDPVSGGALTAQAPFDPTQSYSVSVWVNPAQTATDQTLVSQPATQAGTFYLELGLTDNGPSVFDFAVFGADSPNAPLAVAAANTSPNVNQWYHVVGVFDAAGGTVSLYVNGALAAQVPSVGSFANSGGMSIAYSLWQGGHYGVTNAMLRDLRTFAVALSARDISNLYNSTSPVTVALTSPSAGATLAAPATVNLSAAASVVTGSISRVEFYNGNTMIGQTSTAPYNYVWTGVAAGTYSLSAIAYSSAGLSTTSQPVSITVQASVPSPSSPAPSAQWNLDGSTSGITPDATGRGNSATLSGGYSFVTGKIGKAIQFNGTTGGALTKQAPFDPTQSFSIAAWVNPAQTSAFQGFISQPATTGSTFYLEIGINAGGKLHFDFDLPPQDSPNASDSIAVSNTVPVAGTWYHLVGVYDAVNRQVLLYVNGALESSVPANGSFANTGGLAFGYSKWLGGRVEGSTARIDDVRAYKTALTADQVQLLYQGK